MHPELGELTTAEPGRRAWALSQDGDAGTNPVGLLVIGTGSRVLARLRSTGGKGPVSTSRQPDATYGAGRCQRCQSYEPTPPGECAPVLDRARTDVGQMAHCQRHILSTMSDPSRYSAGTRAALAWLSRGTCYFPGCGHPIIAFIDEEPFVDFQIAHIRDAKPGNRYDKSMDDLQRRAFANLILLCKPHHTLVDKTHPERYSIADLTQWKADREGDSAEALAGSVDLDEDTVEDALMAVVLTIFEGDVYHLGGTGGSAPMAGGGGGGVLGSGTGGPGGRGGSIIVPDEVRIEPQGKSGRAPGAGGGGAGAVAPGSLKRPPGSVTAVLGRGFSAGYGRHPGW